jgi:predicted RNA-binding Zn-ribbon protein involved in translation (DUF1610 family)
MLQSFMNDVKAGKHKNMIVRYEEGYCPMCGNAATVRVSTFRDGMKIVTYQCNDAECNHREFTAISRSQHEE